MKPERKAAYALAKKQVPGKFLAAAKAFGLPKRPVMAYFVNYHLQTGFFNDFGDYLANRNKYKLSHDEAFAIWAYTTNLFYRELNEELRTNRFSARSYPLSQLIISGLKKLPAYKGKAWRHFALAENQLTVYLSANTENKTVFCWQFLSCGNPEESALRNKSGRNIVEYYPKVDARDISELADGIRYRTYPPKELIIFPPKIFRVKDATKLEENYYISLEEIEIK